MLPLKKKVLSIARDVSSKYRNLFWKFATLERSILILPWNTDINAKFGIETKFEAYSPII